MTRRPRILCLVLAIGAVTQAAFAPVATSQSPADPAFLRPCRLDGIEEELRCGSFSVPEDRSRPESRQISLNVVVVPASEPVVNRAPLFYLAGGPGAAATGMAYAFTGNMPFPFARVLPSLRRDRDVVLVDQRGTGGSHPLRCPALEPLRRIERMFPLEAVAVCRRELERIADLTQYTTEAAMHDLDEVREALGYESVNLVGGSYGTSLALAYIRGFPDHVRTATLIGTLPLDNKIPLEHARNGERIFESIFDQCAADAECNAAFPRLRDEWMQLLAELQERPRVAEYAGEAGQEMTITIAKGPFVESVRSLMGFAFSQREIPFLIHEAAAGDFEPLLRRVLAPSPSGMAVGLYLSAQCPTTLRVTDEEAGPATAGTSLAQYRIREQLAACRAWPVTAAPAGWFEPVVADVPVLLITGELDHETPVGNGVVVAESLERSRHIVVPNMAHAPFDASDPGCFWGVVDEFIRRADATSPDASCLEENSAPPFLLSEPAR